MSKCLIFIFLFCALGLSIAEEACANPTLTQKHYRWRRDDGSETDATWRKNEDTPLNYLNYNENMRLRFVFLKGVNSCGVKAKWRLQYATDPGVMGWSETWSGGDWADVPIDTTTASFEMVTTDNYADADITTDQLSAVAGVAWQQGYVVEDPSNQTPEHSYAYGTGNDRYTNYEYAIQTTGNAVAGQTYYFRIKAYDLSYIFCGGTYYEKYAVFAEAVVIPDTITSTWDGSVSTDWDNKLNWDTEVVPRSTGNDSVIIASTANQPVLSTAATITNLTLNSSSTLNLNNKNLTVSGSITNSGIITETSNGVIIHAADSVLLTDSSGTEVSGYRIGAEQVYVRIDDGDENLDGTAVDTLAGVTVTGGTNGDSEVITLQETGLATGIFINSGLITAAYDGLVSGNDGVLELSEGEVVTANYLDSEDNTDSNGFDTTTANFAAASFSVSASSPGIAGSGFSMTVTALDGFGATDIYYNGSVTLSVNYVSPSSGSGSLSKTIAYTFVKGVGTISDQIYSNCGTVNIAATDLTDASMTGTSGNVSFYPSGFDVSVDGVDFSASGGFNLRHTVGKLFHLTVTAKTATNGTCTDYQDPATLSVDYVNPSISQSGTVTPTRLTSGGWTSGIATISNGVYDKWGDVTFTVTDDSVTTQKGTSATVSFLPKDFGLTVETPPTSRTFYYLKEPFDVIVTARDYNDATITNYQGTVTFSGEEFKFPGNYTFVSGDFGVHTFIGISGTRAIESAAITAKGVTHSNIEGISDSVEIKEARIKVLSNQGPVGDLSLMVEIVDSEGNIITKDDSTTFTVDLAEFIGDHSATSKTTSALEMMSQGKANMIVNDNQAESVTVMPKSNPFLEPVSGTATFGTISGRGIGIQMYREIKD